MSRRFCCKTMIKWKSVSSKERVTSNSSLPKFCKVLFLYFLKHLLVYQSQQYFGSLKLHHSDLDISIPQHWWKNDSFPILVGDLASFYLHDYGVSVKCASGWTITFFWIRKWLQTVLIGSTLMSRIRIKPPWFSSGHNYMRFWYTCVPHLA